MTDSEPVPWGKGEKNPERGVKRLWNCMLTKSQRPLKADGVPIEEWTGELYYHARLSRRYGAEAKASLNRANEYDDIDPKPGELAMIRMKSGYNPMEVRTDVRWNARGWIVARGEIPTELGYSWFSPK